MIIPPIFRLYAYRLDKLVFCASIVDISRLLFHLKLFHMFVSIIRIAFWIFFFIQLTLLIFESKLKFHIKAVYLDVAFAVKIAFLVVCIGCVFASFDLCSNWFLELVAILFGLLFSFMVWYLYLPKSLDPDLSYIMTDLQSGTALKETGAYLVFGKIKTQNRTFHVHAELLPEEYMLLHAKCFFDPKSKKRNLVVKLDAVDVGSVGNNFSQARVRPLTPISMY